MSIRDVILYRQYQRYRSDVYPYTKRKVYRRLGISFLLLLVGFLLLVARHSLRPDRPIWFVAYVTLVIGAAIAMGVLAILDFREAAQLTLQSKEQILQEFVHELENEGKSHSQN